MATVRPRPEPASAARPVARERHACPGCGAGEASVFYEMRGAPVHSVLLLTDRERARNFPRGDVALGFCPGCGFIWNTAFDPGVLDYSQSYEETQGFSPTFTAFATRLAERLVGRYGLRGKDIVEVGCGKGEFLTTLCELGGNRGVGIDPAYVAARGRGPRRGRTTFVTERYSDAHAVYPADLVCCKMTLEHIPHTADFVRTIRRVSATRPDTVVFFQVPDVTRILRDIAFWDVYYEHCSYFSPGSLARLFRLCGFEVLDVRREYGDQYVTIEARPDTIEAGAYSGRSTPALEAEDDLGWLRAAVPAFAERVRRGIDDWRSRVRELARSRRRVVLWGGGSKAVAFLTTVGLGDEVAYVVDINPYKHGTFLAGTGHEIVGPQRLREDPPGAVLVVNSIYRQEIERMLEEMGLVPLLLEL